MIWVLGVAGVVLAFAVMVCSAALVEVYRHLAEIRVVLNLADEPTPLRLGRDGLRTTDLGLPLKLALEPEAIAVFLTPKCGTCLTIAEAFRGGSPATVWFVIPDTQVSGALVDVLVDSADRVVLDHDDKIAERLGLEVTPSVVFMSYGEITRAHAVSSARQVMTMIPSVVRAGSSRPGATDEERVLEQVI